MATKINKSLEKMAREINDSDEFVEHIANIARRYRTEHALENSDAQREMRQALRAARKHAQALTTFLDQARRKPHSPEGRAFAEVTRAMDGSVERGYALGQPVLDWLRRFDAAADALFGAAGASSGRDTPRSRAIAAEALRATFEFHRLKFGGGTVKQPSDAARLLLAMAKNAGEVDVSVEDARNAIARSKGTAKIKA